MHLDRIHILVLVTVLFCSDYMLAQKLADGGRHSLVICADSTVRSWGYNGFGQLGNGYILEEHSGVPVSGVDSIVQVAGGLFHSLFVKKNGTVWACGRNTLGPLGDGTNTNRMMPVQVSGLTNITKAAGGGEHSLFIRNDSTVWACGNNTSGQLGDGSNVTKLTPVKVAGLANIIQVAAGAEFSLFLKDDGTVWACGHNGHGQFGIGTNSSSNVPVLVNGLSDIVHISAGEWHALFVKNDGTVYSSGRNQYGQLGDGTQVDKNFPVVSFIDNVIQADAGGIHSVFLKNDGTVYTCGLNSGGNNDGQLGDGTTIDRSTPVQVIASWGTKKIVYAVATREHTLYLTEDGQIWASGRNNYGQLGTGVFSAANAIIPIQSAAVCNALSVSASSIDQEEFQVFLYPNPASSVLVLRSVVSLENALLVIYNTIGQIAKNIDNLYGNENTLYMDDLPNGVYYALVIQRNLSSTVQKIVISK